MPPSATDPNRTASSAPSPRLVLEVERADGRVDELPQGEFRSGAGRLLFVRRGDRLEIRCPRSKELFTVHFAIRPTPQAG